MNELLQANNVTTAQWYTLDIFSQLGNVASEVGRAFKWQSKGNVQLADGAFWRALELLDATISDPKNSVRSREVRRARELFCAVYLGTNEYHESPQSLEEYFMQFARHARYLHL